MSEDGLIRTPSGYNHEPPAPSTFSNSGGILRAQVGSSTDAAALQQNAAAIRQANEAQSTWGSSANKAGGVLSTSLSEGVATETSRDIVAGTAGDSEAASGKHGVVASARSINGRSLSGSEITRSSLVTIHGTTSTVGAALALGLIRVDGTTGLFVDMNSTGPANVPQTPQEARAAQLVKDQAELQAALDARQAERDEADKDTAVPVAEPFDATTEALLSETIAGLGSQTSQAAVHAIIERGELSDGLIANIAGQLGIEGQQATDRAQVLMGAFTAQANRAVGEDNADAIWEWARENRAGDLKKAMVTHANQGTTGQYATIASAYFESLADTEDGRAAIMSSADAQSRGITVDKRTGKVFVEAPKIGKVEWRVAVREGLIKPNHNRR